MRPQQKVVGVFDIAGIACGVACPDESLSSLLSLRYAGFASAAAPEVSMRVAVTGPPPDEVAAQWTGPYARVGGQDGVLTIEGAGFRGAFDEQSGEGWITQARDPAPLETFLTAICAGRLLRDDGFLLHAAAIASAEGAYVFFGPSGSGKTTVAELIGTGVITDEIAVIRRDGECYRVSAVPWRGQRLSAALRGLFRLRQAPRTAFAPLSPVEAVRQLLPSVFFPRAGASELSRFLEIAGDLVTRVPCYEMRFAPDGSFWGAMPRRRSEEAHGRSL